ncbi:hypothetical protein M0805_005068 [Coniferiporia weirii]|nr:hypothetical protein M0805_005068 [Coniferiporia weirii]
MALPTRGRVIIETTVGELDIELWSKETPKTCRNFIALAMEGYYDGVIFHRVVPDFLVQTGDRTGTGGGGESIYGGQFEDEIHPRLRYAHRGLVGMANNNTKNSNDSQFFITLDRTDELHGKHTLFGRCIGDTIFNVMKIGSMELDGDGRPLYPPKIKTVRIVENPFEDIVPRITAAERRVQLRAREQAQREREEEIRRKGAKKDTKLLSFQDDETGEEEPIIFKKKAIVRPDLIDNTEQLAVSINPDLVAQASSSKATASKSRDDSDRKNKETDEKSDKKKRKEANDADSIVGLREKHAKELATAETERQKEISKLEKEIRNLDSRRIGGSDSESDGNGRRNKKTKHSYLEEELAKYEKGRGLKSKKDGRGRKAKDEGDVLAKMDAFKSKLKGSFLDADEPQADSGTVDEGAITNPDGENAEVAMEIDNDTGFLSHKLLFPKDNDEEVAKAERDYEVIDPRQRSARAKEEERERKKQMRPRDGGRGFRR